MTALDAPVLLVPRRFCGPPSSGNGGWTAGSLSVLAGPAPAVEVTLRRPPPLEVALPVHRIEERTVASQDGAPVVEARVVDDALVPVEPVPAALAKVAESSYAGHRGHPFPTCFACGTAREPGDGLRIFPGPVGPGRVASTWVPHPSVADPAAEGHVAVAVTWAALDCASGWASDFENRPMVLGRMTAAVDAAPVVEEPHVVIGEVRGQDGRKTFTASTLFDADGRVVARAEHVWIAIDPAAFV
jgi:hypothetical protein